MDLAIQAVVLTLASASLLPTAWNLYTYAARKKRLRLRGINGTRMSHARFLVRREIRRVVKHVVAIAGVVLMFTPLHDPLLMALRSALFGLLAALLCETSLADRRHDVHLEELLEDGHDHP